MDQDKLDIMRSCYLFTDADEDSLRPLVQASYTKSHQRGTDVFSLNDEADGLRIIISGRVRIWIADQDGKQLTLAFMQPGDTFGEIALLDGLQRTANATAVEDTVCFFLPAAKLNDALARDLTLARSLIYGLCELMRQNLGTISSFAFVGLDARVAQLLQDLALDCATISGGEAVFTRHFSQTDLALLLGVSREAVNKRLKALEREGLIQFRGAALVVPDLAALAGRTGGGVN